VPSILERMGEQVEAFPLERRWQSMLPSQNLERAAPLPSADPASTLGPNAVHVDELGL
jgi:hypothetical protein